VSDSPAQLPVQALLRNDVEQVVDDLVPLSPTWYQSEKVTAGRGRAVVCRHERKKSGTLTMYSRCL